MNLSMGNKSFGRIASTLFIAVAVILPSCASNPDSRSVQDSQQVEETQVEVKETHSGQASFISEAFQGRQTASGEIFDKKKLVAAHPSYPINTVMRVTNLENERVVEVRINDRASTANLKEGIIIDLSPAAAEKLEFVKDGRVRVRTEVLEWGGSRD